MIVRTERRSRLYLGLAVVLVPVLGWIDTITGYELSFSIFYLGPIAVAAWVGGAGPGLALSLLSAVMWGGADVLSGHHYSSPIYPLWNTLIRFVSFSVLSVLLAEREEAHAREFALARTDALTGLANPRYFNEVLDAELNRSRRYGRVLSLVYVDLDNFKTVNDRWGHAAGDALLVDIAATLRQQLRDADTAARLGGDEFAIVLPETDSDAAQRTAERVHAALGRTAARSGYPVTASIGVVTCRTAPRSRDHLLHLADELMYSVKRASKDSVVCSVFDNEGAGVDRGGQPNATASASGWPPK
jgi:diguanylate cyclase (GGDEF)-like protein